MQHYCLDGLRIGVGVQQDEADNQGVNGQGFDEGEGQDHGTGHFAAHVRVAGDTFAGALLAALSRDWPLEKSIRYAQCASAICVTRTGSYSMTRQEEVDRLFAETYACEAV